MFWFLLLAAGVRTAPSESHRQARQIEERGKCADYADFGFYCVPVYQCDQDSIIKTDAAGLFDPRNEDGDCDPSFEDCCPPIRKMALEASCKESLNVCCLHKNSTSQYEAEPLRAKSCGRFGGWEPDSPTTTTTEFTECIQQQPSAEDEIFSDLSPRQTESDGCNQPPENEPTVKCFCSLKDRELGFCPCDEEPSHEPSCGRRNPRGVANVSIEPKADEAEFGEWPHVCAILRKEFIGGVNDPLKIYQCGASLIDSGVVITAAHCLKNFTEDELIVRCGEWNTQNEDEDMPYQELNVSTIKKHPLFNNGNHHNNFALLMTEGEFVLADHISPVCLPRPCAEYTAMNCVANGWGKDKFGSDGRYSTILKEVVYPIVRSNQCQNDLRKTRLGQFFELDDSFICAGGVKGVDTCKGDGGSPLTCRIQGSDRWVQAGIVSWGIGCGEEGTPAVYANVAAAVCWVDNEVKNFFGVTESRFGFLQTVDCNGAVSVQQCRKGGGSVEQPDIDERDK